MAEKRGTAAYAGAADSGIRLAEVMAALSVATDLGMGQPMETALCSCVVAMRLAEMLGFDDAAMRDVYYQSLLRYIGCNAETYAMAALFGDELALRSDFAPLDQGDPAQVVPLVLRYMREARAGEPPSRIEEFVARAIVDLPSMTHENFAGHCEVAQRLAERMGLAPSLIACLGQLYERWDGKGLPRGLKGDEVAPPVLLVSLAQDAVIWNRLGGPGAAVTTVRERSGGAYHPAMAERFCAAAEQLLEGLEPEPTLESVLTLEPGPHHRLDDDEFDRCCAAMADFADIKSPYMLGHSSGVAVLAAGAGRRTGMNDEQVTALRRAGLLHDIGRVGVSAAIWGKQAPLSERQQEQVRLHAYFTDRVLARSEGLHRLGVVASQHHERMDGSGYHRGVRGEGLTRAARILAVADAYHAMSEPRPHRSPLTPEQAQNQLRAEARAGGLDGDAVHAVLAEAGHRVAPVRRERPSGLSGREVEVLRLVARGLTNREMAERLHVSPDTIKHHVGHIYDKIDRSTRAGATLFAMEQGLL